MRLLYISIEYKPNDFYDEFKKHFDVSLYKGVDHAIRFNPDHIHIHAGAIPRNELEQIVKNTSAKVSQFTGDAGVQPLEPVLRHKGLIDITLLTAIEDVYNEVSPLKWISEAIKLDQVNAIKEGVTKIQFIGNYYDHLPEGKTRLELCQALAKRYPDRFEVYGSFPSGTNCKGSIPYEQSHKKYNDSYIGIAQDNYNIHGYFSHRYLGIMGNTLCLGRRFKGADQYFQDGVNIVFWDTVDELLEKCDYYLANPSERFRIAKNGQELVKNNYLYSHWVERFKSLI